MGTRLDVVNQTFGLMANKQSGLALIKIWLLVHNPRFPSHTDFTCTRKLTINLTIQQDGSCGDIAPKKKKKKKVQEVELACGECTIHSFILA